MQSFSTALRSAPTELQGDLPKSQSAQLVSLGDPQGKGNSPATASHRPMQQVLATKEHLCTGDTCCYT